MNEKPLSIVELLFLMAVYSGAGALFGYALSGIFILFE